MGDCIFFIAVCQLSCPHFVFNTFFVIAWQIDSNFAVIIKSYRFSLTFVTFNQQIFLSWFCFNVTLITTCIDCTRSCFNKWIWEKKTGFYRADPTSPSTQHSKYQSYSSTFVTFLRHYFKNFENHQYINYVRLSATPVLRFTKMGQNEPKWWRN